MPDPTPTVAEHPSPPPDHALLVGLAAFAATEDLKVGADGFNPHFEYHYMTEPSLFNAARAALAAAGLSATISFEQGEHETITTLDRDGNPRPAIMATVQARLTIRDQHGFMVECLAYGQGIDPADKAYAKAMTMASKYVVQKALMIAVESDDTDADAGHAVAGRRASNGGRDATASDKQLGYLCAMVKKVIGTDHGETEPMALRLARMNGDPAAEFAKIGKRSASDLIERLKKVEGNPEASTVILERLSAWEAEHPTAEPAAAAASSERAAGEADEPVAATASDDDTPF